MQAVARVDLQAQRDAGVHAGHHALEFALLAGRVVRLGVGAGMQLDHRRAGLVRGADLLGIGIDEQRHAHARLGELPAGGTHALEMAGHVEAALGGQFLALLGHEAGVVRPDLAGDVEHLGRHRAFEVHARLEQRAQRAHVGVDDVAAILAQVQRDRVGAGLLGGQRGADRIGIGGAARVAQRRDVVDVDAEVDDGGRCQEEAHRFCRSIRIWRVASGVPPR